MVWSILIVQKQCIFKAGISVHVEYIDVCPYHFFTNDHAFQLPALLPDARGQGEAVQDALQRRHRAALRQATALCPPGRFCPTRLFLCMRLLIQLFYFDSISIGLSPGAGAIKRVAL